MAIDFSPKHLGRVKNKYQKWWAGDLTPKYAPVLMMVLPTGFW